MPTSVATYNQAKGEWRVVEWSGECFCLFAFRACDWMRRAPRSLSPRCAGPARMPLVIAMPRTLAHVLAPDLYGRSTMRGGRRAARTARLERGAAGTSSPSRRALPRPPPPPDPLLSSHHTHAPLSLSPPHTRAHAQRAGHPARHPGHRPPPGPGHRRRGRGGSGAQPGQGPGRRPAAGEDGGGGLRQVCVHRGRVQAGVRAGRVQRCERGGKREREREGGGQRRERASRAFSISSRSPPLFQPPRLSPRCSLASPQTPCPWRSPNSAGSST